MKMWSWNNIFGTVLAGLGLTVMAVGYADAQQAVGVSSAAPSNIVAPSQVNLPPVPAKVLQMSEAGISDELILAYIQKSANSYTLTAQQIIYLHDLGVSSSVLKTLVEHESRANNVSTDEMLNGMVQTQDVSSESAVDVSTPPVSGAAVNFYEVLSPYGTWVNVPTYGWCWQPTVEVMNPAWQPYCNNGSWLWTDQGWYWNSYYSWGWAPFHYGRWCRYQGYGWLWCPDNVWGPAWVCWRDYPGYCGWAPLPPGTSFTAGVGWMFNGLSVSFNYGFGLGSRYFTFCDYGDFCNRHPFYHFRHGRDAEHFFEHSRVDNDWSFDAHHHFFDHGINPSRIEAATHTHIKQIAVREFPHGVEHFRHFVMPDRLAQNGNRQVIYRPNRDLSLMQNHFQRGTRSVYHWSGQRAVHGLNSEHNIGGPTQFKPSGSNDRQPSRPGIALNRPDLNGFNHNQHWGGVENPPVNHFVPAQNYRYNFSDARRYTRAWHAAPASHPAPTWHPTQTWHTAPAWHPATPTFRSAPVFHQRPAFHVARPTFRAAPMIHSAPAFHSAPSFHPAPAFSHPTRAFGGGGGHFGGVRHR